MVLSCIFNREWTATPRAVVWKYPFLRCCWRDVGAWWEKLGLGWHCCSSRSAQETRIFFCMAWSGVGWEVGLLCCLELNSDGNWKNQSFWQLIWGNWFILKMRARNRTGCFGKLQLCWCGLGASDCSALSPKTTGVLRSVYGFVTKLR